MITDYELKRRIIHGISKYMLNLCKDCASDPYSTEAEVEQVTRVTKDIRVILNDYITGGKNGNTSNP